MTSIQFRPYIYISQNSNPVPAPQSPKESVKTQEITYELIDENIPTLKGETLIKEITLRGVLVNSEIENAIKNETAVGYPQLCKGILKLFHDQKIKKIKDTAHGPVSIIAIAQQYPQSIGKRYIWFVLDFEIYKSKTNQDKLKATILKVWNEKNGPVGAAKSFDEIIGD